MLGELDQRGHGVVLGDGLGVSVEQSTGVGIEELLCDGVVSHVLNVTHQPGQACVVVTLRP